MKVGVHVKICQVFRDYDQDVEIRSESCKFLYAPIFLNFSVPSSCLL